MTAASRTEPTEDRIRHLADRLPRSGNCASAVRSWLAHKDVGDPGLVDRAIRAEAWAEWLVVTKAARLLRATEGLSAEDWNSLRSELERRSKAAWGEFSPG
jgi:hypothetical protein